MANKLWQGNWRTRARIISGLILFSYVFFHLLNVGLGLFSYEVMEASQDVLGEIVESPLGGIALYGALLTHLGLALYRLARRRTLRMPLTEALQIALGLTIPFLLMVHFVHTNVARDEFAVETDMAYVAGLIWNTVSGWQQALLVLIVWIHACIGLHMWLRVTPLWRRLQPIALAFGTLLPAFALAGFMVQGRVQSDRLFRSEDSATLLAEYNFPSAETFATLKLVTDTGLMIMAALVALTAAIFLGRKLFGNRGALRIRYIDGPEVMGQKGMTLLEMSRAAGVPHMALCGGRGRCTTCRVIVEEGADQLHPPSPEEQASLNAVNAPPNARLACQMRPTDPVTVLRVFHADGQLARAHESLGQERRLAILFLDMRSFTARTTGQLPYDVVFLLNRFFDAIVPSITGAGGTVDKYLGDGLLAVFELDSEETSARAALQAAAGISSALEIFNRTLAVEKAEPVRIGMGLHLGELVLGEIGAAENAPRTIIGDTVNAASRLEGETKGLGVELLASEALLTAAGIDVEPLELVTLTLRGVAHPVRALAMEQASGMPDLMQPEEYTA